MTHLFGCSCQQEWQQEDGEDRGSEPTAEVFMSDQEIMGATRGRLDGLGWWKVVITVHTLLLPILCYLQNLHFSSIQLSGHQLTSLHRDLSVVDPFSITCLLVSLPSWPTLDSRLISFPLSEISIPLNSPSIQLIPHPWLDPTFHLLWPKPKQLNTAGEEHTKVLTSPTLYW